MQGIFVIWIPAALVGLSICLLLAPLRAHLNLRLSPMGGAGVLTLGLLLLRHRLRFRVHILEEPPLTLEFIRSDGRILTVPLADKGGRNAVDSASILKRTHFKKIRAEWRIGIAAAPAATAVLAGICDALTREAASFLLRGRDMREVHIGVRTAFDEDACFFSFRGIASAIPAQIIWEILCRKRQIKQYASD